MNKDKIIIGYVVFCDFIVYTKLIITRHVQAYGHNVNVNKIL